MGQLTLPPGFRFSPTDEELVLYYLKSKALGKNSYRATIADVDVYKFEPWDLPGKAVLPSEDQEWYFFSAQDKKYSHTARINRTTKEGYWKATGKDRKVCSGFTAIGLKKTLIYYEGRAPNGRRTNWIMHEYRLHEEYEKKEGVNCAAVLCRIRKKGGRGPRNGEQYGALMLNENVEVEEEEKMGKVDGGADISCHENVGSKGGGNVYNLTDQVEIWKQMGLPSVKPEHCSPKELKDSGFPKIDLDCSDLGSNLYENGVGEGDPDFFAYLQPLLDASEMAPLHVKGGGTLLSCDRYLDVPFAFDESRYLPAMWDADGYPLQNYTGFEESEIIREMSDLISDDQGVVDSTGFMIQANTRNVPLDGDYIELDDIKPALDGFTVRPSVHSLELGRSEEQSEGSAAQTSWLPTQISSGGRKSPLFGLSQAENVWGDDMSIPISNEFVRDSGKHTSGSYSGAGNLPHVVKASTRTDLFKHVSTYAVSKHEMAPAQLFYASSFTDRQKCNVTVRSSPTAPLTAALEFKGKPNVDADTFKKSSDRPIGLHPLPRLLTKSRKDTAADSVKTLPSLVSSPLSCSSPSTSNSSCYVEVSSVIQASNQKAEHENTSNQNRHRWKSPFRVLVSGAKRISMRTRIMELENGMRVKLSDKLSFLGKPGARCLPTGGGTSPFDSLVRGLLATTFQLVAAMLIFFCLFWGFRVLVSYASSVSV